MACPPDCAFCAGTACAACLVDSPDLAIAQCPHPDPIERHRGMASLAQSRVPTRPMPPIDLDTELAITVDDPEVFASALEEIARRVRMRGSIKIK